MDVLIYKVPKPENFSVHQQWLFWKWDPLGRFCMVGRHYWCGPENFSVHASRSTVGSLEEVKKKNQVLSIQVKWRGWLWTNHGLGSQKHKMAWRHFLKSEAVPGEMIFLAPPTPGGCETWNVCLRAVLIFLKFCNSRTATNRIPCDLRYGTETWPCHTKLFFFFSGFHFGISMRCYTWR